MGKLEKKLYFHRAVEMKQPHTMAEPLQKSSLPRRISSLSQGMYDN